ncbi:hypothetical protein Strain138_002188 [Pseudogemmatithrix spongiicola]|uniref:DUF4352 domain-containing protein n=1 Tax=Pseudogemmatithrix spongiicola TaxID=3062599 RepID=A0AA49JVP3_9BACT|nr:hypothetical protein Strain138_002188 [Gemmatimonadaceae bacterium 'strain 138']WKW15784.1 hypothetical protein Strain318_002187 [Gemmatimonadaceae bacterium 'strain 318']
MRPAPRAPWFRLTCALLLSVGCAGSPTEPSGPPSDARLAGLLGSEPFLALAEARIKHTPGAPDSLHLFAQRRIRARNTVEYLSIRIAVAGLGTYSLAESQVILTEVSGGDMVYSEREASSLAPGTLTLSALGTTGELVVGTVQFLLSPADGRTPHPEPVAFTDGVFAIRLSAPLGTPASIR